MFVTSLARAPKAAIRIRSLMTLLAVTMMAGAMMLAASSGRAAADWQADWETALAGAKKEGKLIKYGGYNPVYRDLMDRFEKKYPFIKVEYVPGGASQHAVRILSERRAGRYNADLVMGGASSFQSFPTGTFLPLRDFMILPETKDPTAWLGGKLPFVDADDKYIFTTMGTPSEDIAYNTKLVNPDEITSWRSLLDPKWKGKIGRLKRKSVSATFLFFYHTPSLGPEYIRELFRTAQISGTENLRQGVNWLADGKYAIFLDSTPQAIEEGKAKGLPFDMINKPMPEGNLISGGYCCFAMVERAPNPNATTVFVNWLLSKEGQLALQAVTKRNSLRIDIPKDDVPPELRLQPGMDYFQSDISKYTQPEDLEAIKKLIEEGEAIRR